MTAVLSPLLLEAPMPAPMPRAMRSWSQLSVSFMCVQTSLVYTHTRLTDSWNELGIALGIWAGFAPRATQGFILQPCRMPQPCRSHAAAIAAMPVCQCQATGALALSRAVKACTGPCAHAQGNAQFSPAAVGGFRWVRMSLKAQALSLAPRCSSTHT